MLRSQTDGYIYLQGLLDAIAKGTYNFVDPVAEHRSRRSTVFHAEQQQLDVGADANPGDVGQGSVQPAGRRAATSAVDRSVPLRSDRQSRAPTRRTTPTRTRVTYGINAVGVEGKRHVWSAGYEFDRADLRHAEGQGGRVVRQLLDRPEARSRRSSKRSSSRSSRSSCAGPTRRASVSRASANRSRCRPRASWSSTDSTTRSWSRTYGCILRGARQQPGLLITAAYRTARPRRATRT